MRILAIRGRNLASLAGDFAVELDGPVLGGAGLIAITGPTGAGKSTLLDALCLALFGRTPRLASASGRERVALGRGGAVDGDEVDHRDPRLLLTKGGGEGFAEVDFVGRDGRRYRARWDLRRARGRAGGRLQPAGRDLVALDDGPGLGLDSGRRTEIQREIEERLGLDFDQFRRSVLLAQNEFAEFLKAEPRERGRLLEALTDTAVYTRISVLAHRRHRDHGEELRRLEARRTQIRCLDDKGRRDLEAEVGTAERRLAETRAIHKRLEAEQRWHEEAGRLAGATAEARREWRQQCLAIADGAALPVSERAFLDDEAVAAPALLAQGRALLSTLEPELERARVLDEDLERGRRERDRVAARSAEARRDAERSRGELAALEARLPSLREAAAGYEAEWGGRDPDEVEAGLEREMDRLEGRRLAADELARLLARRVEAREADTRAGREAEEAEAMLGQQRVALAEVERELAEGGTGRDRDDAARLRAGLEPGRPCPVCGSRHHPATGGHPRPADRQEAALEGAGGEATGLEVERVEEPGAAPSRSAAGAFDAVARLEQQRGTLARELGRSEARVEHQARLRDQARALLDDLGREYAELRARVTLALPELGAGVDDEEPARLCAEERQRVEAEEQDKRRQRERLRAVRRQVGELAGLEVRVRDLGELQAVRERHRAELDQELDGLERRLGGMRQERVALCGGRPVAPLVERVRAAHAGAARLEQAVAREQEHDRTRPARGAEAVDHALAELLPRLGRLEDGLAEQRAVLKADDQRRAERDDVDRQLAALGDAARVWTDLDELIGSADGKKLRDFAQSLTLDRMLEGANAHLHDFARRYRIERIPDQALALQVVDRDMGDEVRSVHSLSGGESFLVSLALALGLSGLHTDVTRIDSLFIDEGFGNLDERTLDQALEALDALQAQGRQVALISHVPGLAERLGRQVRVDKLGGGRSRVVVS